MPANAPRENTLPIDPNVKVPAAVLRAAQAADAAHQAHYNPPDPNAPPADANTPPADTPPSNNLTPLGTTPPQPASPHLPQPHVPDTGHESWEHRYKANEGRWRKAQETVNQQADTINQMNTRMQSLESMVANFQQAPQVTPVGNAPPDAPSITPEERETWGEDFMGMVRKLAAEQMAGERANFQNEIGQLRAQLGGVTTHVVQNERDKMTSQLDIDVPNWRTQNRDPNFLAWLNLQDSYSGAIRSALLRDAWDKNITSRVASIFKGFLTEEAAMQPAGAPAPANLNGGRPSLADFAAPGRAKTEATPPGAPSAKPNISRAEIAAFYADVRANRYRGRDKEKNEREAEIFAAEREGRIVT